MKFSVGMFVGFHRDGYRHGWIVAIPARGKRKGKAQLELPPKYSKQPERIWVALEDIREESPSGAATSAASNKSASTNRTIGSKSQSPKAGKSRSSTESGARPAGGSSKGSEVSRTYKRKKIIIT